MCANFDIKFWFFFSDLHDAFVQIEKKEKEMKSIEAKHKELIERKERYEQLFFFIS